MLNPTGIAIKIMSSLSLEGKKKTDKQMFIISLRIPLRQLIFNISHLISTILKVLPKLVKVTRNTAILVQSVKR